MEGQKWTIVRLKTDDPLTNPPQTMILFNDQPLGLVQGYSVGQNVGNAYETLLLEIACPNMEIKVLEAEEFKEMLGSKYAKGGEAAMPTQDDLAFAEEVLSSDTDDKSDVEETQE